MRPKRRGKEDKREIATKVSTQQQPKKNAVLGTPKKHARKGTVRGPNQTKLRRVFHQRPVTLPKTHAKKAKITRKQA